MCVCVYVCVLSTHLISTHHHMKAYTMPFCHKMEIYILHAIFLFIVTGTMYAIPSKDEEQREEKRNKKIESDWYTKLFN